MEIVRLEAATKVFYQGAVAVHALNGVDFVVGTGDFSALIGPSGSGKSTLLNIIGLLERPTTGRVFWQGRDVDPLSPNARADLRRRQLGFVFQHFNLIPVLTAYENVEFPLLLTDHHQRRERVFELLEAVGLADKAGRRPNELSGGEQQRVAIARALAIEPMLVLADEPTGDLDSASTEQVMALMHDLNQSRGITFLFASHDPGVIAFANKVVRLVDGRIVEIEDKASAGPAG